jgi:hypothetical protein
MGETINNEDTQDDGMGAMRAIVLIVSTYAAMAGIVMAYLSWVTA